VGPQQLEEHGRVDKLVRSFGPQPRALRKIEPVWAKAIDLEGVVALASDGDVEGGSA